MVISGQDRRVGRYPVPPHTTKRRTTTNLKIRNNQNCQKIKLYGSLTTKELKKKHSSRLVGGVETGREDSRQGGSWQNGRDGGWQTRWSHICVQINHEEQLGSETDSMTHHSIVGK